MKKCQSVVYPQRRLTYEEWIEALRKEQNVNVSGLYKSRSIEKRVRIDEAKNYKTPQSLQVRREGILFGMKNLLNNLHGMVRLPNLFGKIK